MYQTQQKSNSAAMMMLTMAIKNAIELTQYQYWNFYTNVVMKLLN
jgi:hypothetical protein